MPPPRRVRALSPQTCGSNTFAPLEGMVTCLKCPTGFAAGKKGAAACDFLGLRD